VVVRAPMSAYHVVDNNPLRSHCMQYVLAVAAYEGSVTFSDIMTDRRVSDARIRALAARIEVVGDPSFDREAAADGQSVASVTTVELDDGTTITCDVPHPLGSPNNPLTTEALHSKFETLTAPVMAVDRMQAIKNAVARIEHLSDATALTDLLVQR
jgi:2-methylcitrate dehydratase PrpD